MYFYNESLLVIDVAEILVYTESILCCFKASFTGLVSTVESHLVINRGKCKRFVVFLGFFNYLVYCVKVVSC